MEQLPGVIDALERYVSSFAPERLCGDDADRLVELLDRGTRLCAAGRALATKRAAAANAWKAGGFRSPEEWLAAKTKTSRGAAAEALATAERIENLPATKEALVSGQVSVEQAAAIAAAATADPTSEDLMLREAERSSLGGLQKTSRALVAAALKNQAVDRERIHRSRYFKSWTSYDDALEGRFRLTPDAGAILLAAIDAERREVFAQAKADSRYETDIAYAADALVNLARNSLDGATSATPEASPTATAPSSALRPELGGGMATESTEATAAHDVHPGGSDPGGSYSPAIVKADAADDAKLADSIDLEAPESVSEPGQPKRRRGRTPPHVVHIRVDLDALLRGHTQAGEVCEAVGVGPVSVGTAQHALCDAIVRVLKVKDGQVIDICHAGRTIPTKLALALEERDRTCCVPGCDSARYLQNHHLHPVNFLGPTGLANLARICSRHHEQITHQGAQLTGTPGNWTWHPPGTNVPHPIAGPPRHHDHGDGGRPPDLSAERTLAFDLR